MIRDLLWILLALAGAAVLLLTQPLDLCPMAHFLPDARLCPGPSAGS
jgi:hypothetical protein